MPLLGSLAGGSVKGFGAQANLGYFLGQSLRFRSSASAYLSRTPASAGNRKTWTWSAWVKRSKQTGIETLFKAYTDSTNSFSIYFGNTSLSFGNDTGTIGTSTASTFRDPSAWYHIVFALDTTQATASDRCKLWVNGTLQPLNTLNAPSLNQDLEVNNSSAHYLGGYTGYYFDGYMGDVYLVDGQALTPSDFGKTDASTGQWIPKKYSGTYGTNGFYLNFSDGTSTTTLGYDYSGNSNNWTTNNISLTAGTTYDLMYDVPTLTSEDKSNFATLNPLSSTIATKPTEGNLYFNNDPSNNAAYLSTIGVSTGKWYWEYKVASQYAMMGVTNRPDGFFGTVVPTNVGSLSYTTYNGSKEYSGSSGGAYMSVATNDIVGVALDLDAGTIVMYKNGVSQGTMYSGLSGTFFPHLGGPNGWGAGYINFGQRPFTYTPPTGHKKINTYNL